jgi:hypothetical protein
MQAPVSIKGWGVGHDHELSQIAGVSVPSSSAYTLGRVRPLWRYNSRCHDEAEGAPYFTHPQPHFYFYRRQAMCDVLRGVRKARKSKRDLPAEVTGLLPGALVNLLESLS